MREYSEYYLLFYQYSGYLSPTFSFTVDCTSYLEIDSNSFLEGAYKVDCGDTISDDFSNIRNSITLCNRYSVQNKFYELTPETPQFVSFHSLSDTTAWPSISIWTSDSICAPSFYNDDETYSLNSERYYYYLPPNEESIITFSKSNFNQLNGDFDLSIHCEAPIFNSPSYNVTKLPDHSN